MKYVIVTGAYGGMGKETVTALRNEGYHVFALDKKVSEKQDGITPIEVDVTDTESIEKAYEKIKQVTDDIYAIIHLAGIYTLDSLVEMSEEKFIKSFNVNVFGAFRINKTFVSMLKCGSKIIIMTSELAPLKPLPFTGIYAITKSTLDNYAYSLRMEVQLLGISVSVIRSGAVKTNILADSMREIDKFCANTKLYTYNSERFKKIVNGVETRNVSPKKIANKILKITRSKRPKNVYKINRNPLLLTLNLFPESFQTWVIKKILTRKKLSKKDNDKR